MDGLDGLDDFEATMKELDELTKRLPTRADLLLCALGVVVCTSLVIVFSEKLQALVG